MVVFISDVAVLGLGNLILGDDGVGIKVVRELEDEIPDKVDVIDGGTAGYGLLNIMDMYDKLIVVDAINFGGEKGDIDRLEVDDIEDISKINISAHDLDFVDAVKISNETGNRPEIVVYGIEVGYVDRTVVTMDLSPEVEKAIDKVIKLIKEEINS